MTKYVIAETSKEALNSGDDNFVFENEDEGYAAIGAVREAFNRLSFDLKIVFPEYKLFKIEHEPTVTEIG